MRFLKSRILLLACAAGQLATAAAADIGTTRGVIDIARAERPADAVVLVGADGHRLVPEGPGPGKWTFADGVLTASPGWDSVVTPEAYQDFRMHVEFNVNEVEDAKDPEADGNSGIYLQQRYELQILNSFGVAEADYKPSYCGSLYRQKKPDRLVCKKAGEWQSYDIAFRAARFEGGVKTANARITVYQNGQLIHDDHPIPGKTGAGEKEGPEPRPVKLQGHHNEVRFRNLWIQKLSAVAAPPDDPRLNILLFTADDMNFDSSGVYGGPLKDLTPNIDRLAAQGLRFEHAYTVVAVCQPSRQVMLTGLYPHRSGSMGFFPLKPEVITLNDRLHDAGYLISTLGKNAHHQPAGKFHADPATDGISRHPSKLAEATRSFLRAAREQGRPFFHNVNCYDPHRPFIGMKGPDDLAGGEAPSRRVSPAEITRVPAFLEDLPDIHRELAGYYTNVRRLDDALGAVLKVLDEEGFAENTLVVFWGGDHGMSFPFGKSNVYENSSRGALILRRPGVTKPGRVDRSHLVSTLDFTPTLLDAAGLPPVPGVDGRSFLPAMRGETMPGWDRVFTSYNAAFGNRWLPMRCVRTRDKSYIWNAWSDGKTRYQTENMAGLTWQAMLAAAATDPAVKARTDFYRHRVPEEFYDLASDPAERRNLIADPARQAEIEALRTDLLALMRRSGDPFAGAFAARDDKTLVPAVIRGLKRSLAPASEAGTR